MRFLRYANTPSDHRIEIVAACMNGAGVMSLDIVYDVENSRIPGNQLDRAEILIRCDIITSQVRGDGQQRACFSEAKGVPRRQ